MSNNVYLADSESPIIALSAKKYFEELPTLEAKKYAHYLSRASHWGTRAVLRSVSPESETIYDLILAIHSKLEQPETNETYIERFNGKVDAVHVTQYLEYASQFLSNLGNFKSFGDKKFIPRLDKKAFGQLIESIDDENISNLYKSVEDDIYSLDAVLLGWPSEGHVSSYYPQSQQISKSEVELVNAALASKGIMPENTRVVKKTDKDFIVLVASAIDQNTTSYYPKESFTYEGVTISFQFGDHQKEFEHIVSAMENALENAANDTQKKMITSYIESFKTGSMNAHKDSQIAWVKDLGPLVETNIGFIETYRDPSGVRGEWEGLVAMVNQSRTAKFSTLVNRAGELLPLLPWDSFYEKDKFTPPDFTSLEVLTFAGSGVPAGINIPNYDDVRLNIGFKNVSLGNVLSANPKKPKKEEIITFIEPELSEKFRKWRDDAFEVQVGLHELLGHGSGKLLQEVSPGQFNFDKEANSHTSYYKPGETWGSVFGSTSGAFEECRAELVALYLILKEPEIVLPIFEIKKEDYEDVVLIATILMCRAGLLSLEFWDPKSKKWGQPHMQARYGIFQTLYRAGVVTIEEGESPDFDGLKLKFHPENFKSAGVESLGKFLHDLHVYKSTANSKEGIAYFNDITSVNSDFAKYRDAVLNKKLPRKQLIQANTFDKGNDVEIKEYEESEVGMIQSFFDRAV